MLSNSVSCVPPVLDLSNRRSEFAEARDAIAADVRVAAVAYDPLEELLYPSFGGRVGPETVGVSPQPLRCGPRGEDLLYFARYDAVLGSHRYVAYRDEVFDAVAALQVVSRENLPVGLVLPGPVHQVANVFTVPRQRRKGYASALYRKALADFPGLALGEFRSADGDSWCASVGRRVKVFWLAGVFRDGKIDIVHDLYVSEAGAWAVAVAHKMHLIRAIVFDGFPSAFLPELDNHEAVGCADDVITNGLASLLSEVRYSSR